MHKLVTLDNIVEFLKNYSYGSLSNFKRSVQALPTPFTFSKKNVQTRNTKISIAEVSSDFVLQKIMHANKVCLLNKTILVSSKFSIYLIDYSFVHLFGTM